MRLPRPGPYAQLSAHATGWLEQAARTPAQSIAAPNATTSRPPALREHVTPAPVTLVLPAIDASEDAGGARHDAGDGGRNDRAADGAAEGSDGVRHPCDRADRRRLGVT